MLVLAMDKGKWQIIKFLYKKCESEFYTKNEKYKFEAYKFFSSKVQGDKGEAMHRFSHLHTQNYLKFWAEIFLLEKGNAMFKL